MRPRGPDRPARRRLAGALGAVVLAAFGLAGCATRPPDVAGLPWTSGRLSVRVDVFGERPASSVTADFDLRGNSRQGELRLTSPLGTRIANTRWRDGEVVLQTGQGETRYPDLETLSRDTLGEPLPLQALPDWLAGRPWAGAPATAVDQGFVQLGWTVSLAGWAEGRIEAVRAAPPVVTVRVRLERGG